MQHRRFLTIQEWGWEKTFMASDINIYIWDLVISRIWFTSHWKWMKNGESVNKFCGNTMQWPGIHSPHGTTCKVFCCHWAISFSLLHDMFQKGHISQKRSDIFEAYHAIPCWTKSKENLGPSGLWCEAWKENSASFVPGVILDLNRRQRLLDTTKALDWLSECCVIYNNAIYDICVQCSTHTCPICLIIKWILLVSLNKTRIDIKYSKMMQNATLTVLTKQNAD